VLATFDAAESVLKTPQVRSVPGGEENVTMIAVPSPPLRSAPAGAPERLAVVASDDEEGVELLGIEFLDAFPSSEKVRKRVVVQGWVKRLVFLILQVQLQITLASVAPVAD
jgi:hypothetical protein